MVKKFNIGSKVYEVLHKQEQYKTIVKIAESKEKTIEEILDKITNDNIAYIEHLKIKGDVIGAQKLQSILTLANS